MLCRAGALILEVKGDFCHSVRRMLEDAGRAEDYLEIGLEGSRQWKPLADPVLDTWSLACTIVLTCQPALRQESRAVLAASLWMIRRSRQVLKRAKQVGFLRLPEVLARTGLSRSTVYVRLHKGRFPRPVSLGARAVGRIEAGVDEWMRQRIAESRDGTE